MVAFVPDYVSVAGDPGVDATFDRRSVENAITNTLLQGAGMKTESKFRFRLADESDVEDIGRLVQGLADFEKEPDAVEVGSKESVTCNTEIKIWTYF